VSTSPDPVIGAGAAGDIPAVLALWRDAEVLPGSTDDAAALEQLMGHDPAALVVARSGGAVVGVLIAAWDGWRGNMYRLAVHPDHRGEGLARALVEAGEARLRRCGARRVTALVVHDDVRAAAAWRALGYEHDARMARYVKTLA
jgi:ribosomal protein S18 acetylase RimI-like enzyme